MRIGYFRKSLQLLDFGLYNCCFTSFFHGMGCAFLADGILLSGQRTRLAQPRTAPPLRPRSDAGILLFLVERVAVLSGGGGQTRPPAPLPPRARIVGLHPTAPTLLVAAQHKPHPVPAPATLEDGIPTRSRGRAERTVAAPRPSRRVTSPPCFSPLGIFSRGCSHNSVRDPSFPSFPSVKPLETVNLNGRTYNLTAQGVSLLKERMHVPVLHQGNEGNEEFYCGRAQSRMLRA